MNDRPLLPLADEPGPAGTCALDEDAYRERLDRWRAVLDGAAGRRDGAWFVWELPESAQPRVRDLEELVEAELACCSFLRLRVTGEPRRVALRVSMDPARRPAAGTPAEEAARLLGAIPGPGST